MRRILRIPCLALAISLGTAASAAGQEGVTRVEETIPLRQPPARSFLGFAMVVRDGGYPHVVDIMEGSPADQGGLAKGDTVVAVDGKDWLRDPVNLRLFEPGQRFTLRVRRGGNEMDLVIVPDPPRRRPAPR